MELFNIRADHKGALLTLLQQYFGASAMLPSLIIGSRQVTAREGPWCDLIGSSVVTAREGPCCDLIGSSVVTAREGT